MLTKLPSLKKNNYLFLLILIILTFRLMTLYFSSYDLQGDEAQYWFWSTNFNWGYYSKPPLIAWVISLFSSVFGSSIFIIKLPSLVSHSLTAIFLYYLSGLFKRSKTECLWVSITYLTFFAVTLSSNIISTDPLLLLFWTSSLFFFKLSLNQKSQNFIYIAAVCVALGIYAKYAMIYFFLCSFIFCLFQINKKFYFLQILKIFIICLFLLLPHFFWIYKSQFVTIFHTGENFNWGSSLFNFDKLFSFIISQFVIATPIVFFIYLKGFLKFKNFINIYIFEISYSVPILLLITIQSFISRANANWSSVAFISIAMIFTNIMFNRNKKLLYINSIIGIIIMVLFSTILLKSPNISLLNKLKGMKGAAQEIEFLDKSLTVDYIVFDDRMNIAKFLYYLPLKIKKIKFLSLADYPSNHFELEMPITRNQLINKKILLIHKYQNSSESTNNKLLVQQLYVMPNKKNNFYISYLQ